MVDVETMPLPAARWRQVVARRPVLWFWVVAVTIELIVIPVFLVSGAEEGLDAALTATGIDFNTDLVTAFRLVVGDQRALAGVLLSIVQVAAPDLAVLAVGAVTGGGQLRRVGRRFRFWAPQVGVRHGLAIWAAMVALFTAMNLATAGLNALTAGGYDFRWNIRPLFWPLIIGLIVAMFLDGGAVFEENGWRGFALPLLQHRHGPLLASVVLGVLWALWHLPVKFDLFGYGAAGATLLIGVLTAKFIALTIIMTFFFNTAGGATILAIAMHGLSNDSVRVGGFVFGESLSAYALSEINLLIPLATVATLITLGTRGRLGFRARASTLPGAGRAG